MACQNFLISGKRQYFALLQDAINRKCTSRQCTVNRKLVWSIPGILMLHWENYQLKFLVFFISERVPPTSSESPAEETKIKRKKAFSSSLSSLSQFVLFLWLQFYAVCCKIPIASNSWQVKIKLISAQ